MCLCRCRYVRTAALPHSGSSYFVPAQLQLTTLWLTHHGRQVDRKTRGVVRVGAEDLPADLQRLLCVVLSEKKKKKAKRQSGQRRAMLIPSEYGDTSKEQNKSETKITRKKARREETYFSCRVFPFSRAMRGLTRSRFILDRCRTVARRKNLQSRKRPTARESRVESAVDKPRYAKCGRDRRQHYRPTNSNTTATQASASQPSSTNPGT